MSADNIFLHKKATDLVLPRKYRSKISSKGLFLDIKIEQETQGTGDR